MTTSRALATSGIKGHPRTYPILADGGHEANGRQGSMDSSTNHSQTVRIFPLTLTQRQTVKPRQGPL